MPWTPEEVQANPEAAFDVFDRDGNGEISPAELIFTVRQANTQGERRGSLFAEMQIFSTIDTDGNGSISKDEFIATIKTGDPAILSHICKLCSKSEQATEAASVNTVPTQLPPANSASSTDTSSVGATPPMPPMPPMPTDTGMGTGTGADAGGTSNLPPAPDARPPIEELEAERSALWGVIRAVTKFKSLKRLKAMSDEKAQAQVADSGATAAVGEDRPLPQHWEYLYDEDWEQHYYYHSLSGHSQWHFPEDAERNVEVQTVWKHVVDEANGCSYYYNSGTGETSWHDPTDKIQGEGTFVDAVEDTTSQPQATSWEARFYEGYTYYVNVETGESQWDMPAELANYGMTHTQTEQHQLESSTEQHSDHAEHMDHDSAAHDEDIGTNEWEKRYDEAGRPYAYNIVTGHSHWITVGEQPESISVESSEAGQSEGVEESPAEHEQQTATGNDEVGWVRLTDPETSQDYYLNQATGETHWAIIDGGA